MCLSTHILFPTRFITLFPASLPRVNLMHLRPEDQPHLPAVLSNMLQAENLAIFHLWGFLQSPLLLTIAELMLDQYKNSAPCNATHHHHGELLYAHTNPCIPESLPYQQHRSWIISKSPHPILTKYGTAEDQSKKQWLLSYIQALPACSALHEVSPQLQKGTCSPQVRK